MSESALTGVLLVNLGTPDAPDTKSVRRYLRQFLSDPRVVTMPAPLRWLLLNLVILPTRPRRSAEAYQKVWTAEGSPLLVHSRALARGVASELGDAYRVELAMRYGEPSIEAGLRALRAAAVERVLVLPLFPQYASSVTDSVEAEVERLVGRLGAFPPVEFLGAFFDDPGFIEPWAALAGPGLAEFGADHVLFSFHGLPEDQIRASDLQSGHCLSSASCCDAPGTSLPKCYRAQCYRTADALTRALALDAETTSLSFQSRLGPRPWIRPFTDEVVEDLARAGHKRLAVFCPSFVADCLETLEEIGMRLTEQWREAGGEALWLAPCPNGDPSFAASVAGWLREHD